MFQGEGGNCIVIRTIVLVSSGYSERKKITKSSGNGQGWRLIENRLCDLKYKPVD